MKRTLDTTPFLILKIKGHSAFFFFVCVYDVNITLIDLQVLLQCANLPSLCIFGFFLKAESLQKAQWKHPRVMTSQTSLKE